MSEHRAMAARRAQLHDRRAEHRAGCSTCAAASTRSPAAATPTTRIPCGTSYASRDRSTRASCTSSPDYPGDWFFQGLRAPTAPLLGVQLRGVRRRVPRPASVRLVTRPRSDRHRRPRRVQQHAGHGGRAAPPLPRARAAVVRAGEGPVVDHNWIEQTVHTLIDQFVDDGPGRAQRRLRRRHPRAHHHRQLRRERRAGARSSGSSSPRHRPVLRDPRADHRRASRAARRTTSSACWSRPSTPTRTASPTA